MKVLFIGGTGLISSACSRLAIAQGMDLYLLNRGQNQTRPAIPEAHLIRADIRDPESARAALEKYSFDVVVDFIAFTPAQIETDLALFGGKVGQYIFISSASAYQKPVANLPITEFDPAGEPLLALLTQQNCLRRTPDARLPRRRFPDYYSPPFTYIRQNRDPHPGWLDGDRAYAPRIADCRSR